MGILDALKLPPRPTPSGRQRMPGDPTPALPVMAAAPLDPPPPGGGGSGDGPGPTDSLSDDERRAQLSRWKQAGQVDGDVSGLKQKLADKRDKVAQREARKTFDQISQAVGKLKPGEKATVPDQNAAASHRGASDGAQARRDGGERADAQRISTARKERLDRLLSAHKLSDDDRRRFGEWLKKNHGEGDVGTEGRTEKGGRTPDSHDHLETPEDVERALRQFRAEQSRGKKGSSGGGNGPGGGAAPDGGPGPAPAKPQAPPTKPGTTPPAKPTATPPAKPSTTPPAKPSTTPPAKPTATPPAKPTAPARVYQPNTPSREIVEGVARAGRKLPIIKSAGQLFRSGIKLYFSNVVQVPLRILGELDAAMQAIGSVESALRGEGFVLKAQVALAKQLSAATGELSKAWRDGRYHALIDQAIRTAAEIDRDDPEGLYGADALSTFCAGIESEVARLESDLSGLLADLRQMVKEIDQGEALCRKLLGNLAFMALADLSKQDVVVFMAWQDFQAVQNLLGGLPSLVETQHKEVEADLRRVREHIIGTAFGILDESGDE